MNLKEFTEKFPKCPKCNQLVNIDTIVIAEYPIFPFAIKKVVIGRDKIKIASDDPISNLKRLDFSVDYLDGTVKVYNATKKGDLDKFKELSITVDIACKNCGFGGLPGFHATYGGTYSSKDFSFSNFGVQFEEFTYAIDEKFCILKNYYADNRSSLSIHKLNLGGQVILSNLPLMSIDIFDFSDRTKMEQKLSNITLLA